MGATALAGLAISSLVAACGGAAPTTESGTKALSVGIFQEPDSLDPAATGLAMSSMMISHVFDPMVWYLPDENGENQFYPGLAKSWEVSEDSTVYTFHLRDDVKFHDGTPLDATAVQATFDHIVDPETRSRSAIGALGPYKETRVVDEYTAEIVFSQPYAAFLREMTTPLFGIQSPTALKKYGADAASHPTGTGPFKFVEYVAQDHVSMERYADYAWGPEVFGDPGPAKLEKLDFKILLDTNARANALRGGQIQVAMNLDPDTIQTIQAGKDFTHYDVPSSGHPYGFPINVAAGPTDDLRVRQAILHAVDQDELNKTVLHGAYTPAHNFLTPSTPGYVKANDDMYAYDPDKARALLDEAGWVAGADGTRTKNGEPLSLKFLIQSANGFELPTQYVVDALKQVGFTSTTESQPFTTAMASYNEGVQNMSAIFYYDVDPNLMSSLVTSGQIESGFNWAHYDNPEIDKAITEANAIVDPDARTAAYEKITTTLMQDAIFLPLWNVSGIYSAAKNLQDIHFGASGYSLFHTAHFA
jgi:peptide/nickel transport system substrate-binding protein